LRQKLIERGAFVGESAVTWHDALRGRLAVAALNLAAAMAIGDVATTEWARHRFAILCTQTESDGAETNSVLATEATVQRIDAFSELIGDMEPLAPDVDYELDPLLRRDLPVPAGPAPVLTETLEQKKARLKKLLIGKTEK